MRVILCFFVIVAIIVGKAGISQPFPMEKEIKKLDSLEGKELVNAVILIHDSLKRITDHKTKECIVAKVTKITHRKSDIAYAYSLVERVQYSDSSNPSLFDSAYKIAIENDNPVLMMMIRERSVHYYLENSEFDKAMFNVLMLNDLTSVSGDDEAYRNSMNLLADIYYKTRLYDKASEYYIKLLNYYIENDELNYWRPYMIMNDLGQIEFNKGNYFKAISWFFKSYNKADSNLFQSCRNNTLAYCCLKISESYLQLGEVDNAANYIKTVESYPKNSLYEDVLQELIYIKALLYYEQQLFDEALVLTSRLHDFGSDEFTNYRFMPEVFNLISNIYNKKGDLPKAVTFMKIYTNVMDSLEKQGGIARSMIILAENNYNKINQELDVSEKKVNFLFISILLLIILGLAALFYYKNYYNLKLRMLKNSMLKSSTPIILPVVKDTSKGAGISEEEKLKQTELIVKLNDLIVEKKNFLDPKVNIVEIADILETNRTYLSKAINNQLKTTFPALVNEYRIRESINLILLGFTDNHTIEALAKQSGFSSRSVFFSAFKKNTGLVPSFFISNYKKVINSDEITEVKISNIFEKCN